ncbi:helix-turn-helix domain-containing protein [Fervidibacillus halotolerans]|uniref:Helix-turn-helix domain-containing protein n=1 Tax=Fervidibacillus halotolerans TaxID=2980027 RepID=A0A9E8RXJ4_9BACI|nr:helix-turn-helix transcriptional regulator [Fervidibacillus halotolerans]WAA11821.1 helix-turn-helix domain-containing protein [Fervidibacillus halotolerans]
MQTLGQKISFYRKNLRISQEELAFRTRTGVQKIQLIENDQLVPSKEMLLKLSTVLEVPVSELEIDRTHSAIH